MGETANFSPCLTNKGYNFCGKAVKTPDKYLWCGLMKMHEDAPISMPTLISTGSDAFSPLF